MSVSFPFTKVTLAASIILLAGAGLRSLTDGSARRGEYDRNGKHGSGDAISLNHHHSHNYNNDYPPFHPHDGNSKDVNVKSDFDFYIFTMTYQPEFCRENSSKDFAGCQRPEEYWEGQLTIHGLWPEVRSYCSIPFQLLFSLENNTSFT